jgi:hypothetical protein
MKYLQREEGGLKKKHNLNYFGKALWVSDKIIFSCLLFAYINKNL